MNPGLITKKYLNGKTILITGASGFIGGRLIERLKLDFNCQVKALVRNINHSIRISRFEIDIIIGDVTNFDLLNKIAQQTDLIIHCAVGSDTNENLNKKITIDGTKNVMEAALLNKVKRVIYFSSVVVYGYPINQNCNELSPYKKVTGDWYNNSKIEAEIIVKNYIKKGLPTVILQPTIVYGPYSGTWTIGPVNEIKKNRLFLVKGGAGICNPLYIDNIIDAVFLALQSKNALGETFIISDGIKLSWREFYNVYLKMLNKNSLPLLKKSDKRSSNFIYFFLLPLAKINKLIYRNKFYIKYFGTLKKKLLPIYRKSQLYKNYSGNYELFFGDRAFFEIKKAQKILGYSPRVIFLKGMELTESWLKFMRLI